MNSKKPDLYISKLSLKTVNIKKVFLISKYNRKSWVQGLKPGLNIEPEIFFTFTNNIFRKHKTSDISLIRILDWFWKILGLFIRSNILTKNIYHTFFTIQFIISNCVIRYTNMEVYPVFSVPDIETRFLLQYFSQKSLIIVNQTITKDLNNHLHFWEQFFILISV